MSESCPTVKIVFDNEQGYCLINESDFDPEVHKLFESATPVEAAPPTEVIAKKSKKGE